MQNVETASACYLQMRNDPTNNLSYPLMAEARSCQRSKRFFSAGKPTSASWFPKHASEGQPPKNAWLQTGASNKCLTSSNKKLLETGASLLVTSALLVVTRSLVGPRFQKAGWTVNGQRMRALCWMTTSKCCNTTMQRGVKGNERLRHVSRVQRKARLPTLPRYGRSMTPHELYYSLDLHWPKECAAKPYAAWVPIFHTKPTRLSLVVGFGSPDISWNIVFQ